jgi:S-adenosylmethionine-diacylglycerol 3-amino-3-carboxypropyl transferase
LRYRCCVWIAALGLKPGVTVVTIASGGCNALAYLATGPKVVHAIDLNGTHLAMLDHKPAALAH